MPATALGRPRWRTGQRRPVSLLEGKMELLGLMLVFVAGGVIGLAALAYFAINKNASMWH